MIFETERLIARRFDPRDLEAFVAMRADPDVARYQSWDSFTETDGRQVLASIAVCKPGDPGWFQIALQDKLDGQFIGDCGLRIMESDARLAEIGYTIVRRFWNRGLASEVVEALTAYAFASFPLHRITASADPRNTPSCRVLEKAGYRKEAHFRQSEWFKGAWTDDVVYAKLRVASP